MIAMTILAAIGENYAKQSLDGGGVIIISVYIKMDGWMDGFKMAIKQVRERAACHLLLAHCRID
jgi:hypothetical protein